MKTYPRLPNTRSFAAPTGSPKVLSDLGANSVRPENLYKSLHTSCTKGATWHDQLP